MKRHIFVFLFSFFFSFQFLFFGCYSRDRYTYKGIKAEFSPPKPEIVTQEKDTEGIRTSFTLSEPLTIKQAIIIALRNNPDIDMTIARIRGSEAMIDEAAAAFWPILSLYGEYTQGDAPSAYLFKTIDQRQLPPQVNFNDPGWFENYEVGIQGRINLFRGGRDILRKRMAETGLEIHQLDRESIENALVASVIQSYYNALAAENFIQIAGKSVETVSKQLRIMQIRYRAGGALRSDILSLDVRLAQAKEDLVRAENHYSLSVASLSNLLGMDPDTSITLTHKDNVPVDAPADYRSGLVHALANRPELKKIRKQVIQTRMALDSARLEYLPRLDAQSKYYLDDPGLDFDWDRENWTAGIILNWDVFTGNSTRAQIDKAKSVLEEMLAADRKTTLSVQLDLKKAYLKLEEAEARVAVTEASVAQAEESLRLVKKQYEGGSATITRYLDAELTRNVARIRATAAFYDREKAHAEVARALGYWVNFARKEPNHDQ